MRKEVKTHVISYFARAYGIVHMGIPAHFLRSLFFQTVVINALHCFPSFSGVCKYLSWILFRGWVNMEQTLRMGVNG